MAEQKSPIVISNSRTPDDEVPHIPVEIVSEEEMALLDAALFAARSSFNNIFPSSYTKSFSRAVSVFPPIRARSCSDASTVADIEDCDASPHTQKRVRENESFFQRFRRKRGLSVTDITATEWCEKQMEFVLVLGKPKKTKAMKAGTARHVKLEEEVIQKVKVEVKTTEDMWALKLINCIIGVNQLLSEGLTRELPLVVFVGDVWIVGVIDEIRMDGKNPMLVDTKTRTRSCLPTEAQRRNGRLQVMCYKYLWDTLATEEFPCGRFFDFFGLNPKYRISPQLKESMGLRAPLQTLEDLVGQYSALRGLLSTAEDGLLLRYELQEDQSLLGEDWFAYEGGWLKAQLRSCLEFWRGDREPRLVVPDERWKCRFCKFLPSCPSTHS